MDVLENLVSTAEPAFASDRKGCIVAWNESAERLLGHAASDVIGKHCFDVLDGKDVFGNRFCDELCPIRNMVRRHEPVHHCQLSYRTASSDRIGVSVSVFVVFGEAPSEYCVVHVLESIGNLDDGSRLGIPDSSEGILSSDKPTKASTPYVELTTRETEVLRLLATGSTTPKVARRLSISEATVRNHVRNILNKLDVHSRLEAVCLAIRHRLF